MSRSIHRDGVVLRKLQCHGEPEMGTVNSTAQHLNTYSNLSLGNLTTKRLTFEVYLKLGYHLFISTSSAPF